MTTSPFFSIIIPVYNGLSVGLGRCLESIWSQPLDSSLYEVICVDDLSTDGTKAWLKQQAQQHVNLRIVENSRNLRQGGARNNGFRAAKGKYIMLIDQDDYYHPGVFRRVCEHLQKSNDLDLLIVDCAYEYPGHVSNVLQHNFPHRHVMSGDEIIAKNSIPYAPWKFIFKRSIVIDNGLFFHEGQRIEDVDWVHRLTHYCTRVQYQPFLFIHYQKTPVSTTMTSFSSPETVYSGLNVVVRMNRLLENEFSKSPSDTKKNVAYVRNLMARLNVRSFFFFYDSIYAKAVNLKTSLEGINWQNKMVKYAFRNPKKFSAITNIVSPLGRIGILIYRRIKYRKID